MTEAIVINLGVLVALALSYAAISLLPALLVKRRAMRVMAARSRGRLALTYDDGPGPHLTAPLLELLAQYGARATFFLVGFRAERFPSACEALLAGGHELACHTHMHRNAWRSLPWKAARDVHDGYRRMSRWMARNAPFRPPFGKLTTWSWLAADQRQAPICFWTCDGCDTHEALPDPEIVARRLVRAGGGVVLLHSHDRGAERQQYVLAVTEHLLRAARENNYQVCMMSELLGIPAAGAPQRAGSAAPAAASTAETAAAGTGGAHAAAR